MNILSRCIDRLTLPPLQAAFLTIRPRIVRHARIFFRRLACPQRKDACIAEVVAQTWK